MSLLCLPVAWRSVDRRIHLARLILSVLGIGMIIYLFAEELFIFLQSLCVLVLHHPLRGFLLFVIIVTTSPALLASDSGRVAAGAD